MPPPLRIMVPLLNPNEPEARLAALHVANGQAVRAGQALCTLETTKASVDLAAERDGHIVALQARQGDVLTAGQELCWIADNADWRPAAKAAVTRKEGEDGMPAGLRITRPALALARQSGLGLERLPVGPLITEAEIRQRLAASGTSRRGGLARTDPRALIVYGGGGHGKSLIELIRCLGAYEIAGVIDDGLPSGMQVLGVPVLGGAEALPGASERGVGQAANAVGGIGDVMSRVRVFERLEAAGFTCPALIHPTAFLEASSSLSQGVQVFPLAYVGSDVHVGFGVIVNTSAVVSHDCRLGDYANVAPGALLAGGVTIGEAALIGMGVTVNLGVTIGAHARVGNSAVVKGDVPEGGMVRAGTTWPSP